MDVVARRRPLGGEEDHDGPEEGLDGDFSGEHLPIEDGIPDDFGLP